MLVVAAGVLTVRRGSALRPEKMPLTSPHSFPNNFAFGVVLGGADAGSAYGQVRALAALVEVWAVVEEVAGCPDTLLRDGRPLLQVSRYTAFTAFFRNPSCGASCGLAWAGLGSPLHTALPVSCSLQGPAGSGSTPVSL